MPLQKAPIPIQFTGGVSTKPDPKGVPPTKLLDLQNATFIRETTLAKRNGYRALSKRIDTGSAEYSGARGLAQRGDEMLLFTDADCYSYRPSLDRWSLVGGVSSVVATDKPVARTGTQQTQPDIATNGGVSVVAWEDSRGGVWCCVLEDGTDRMLLAPTQLDSAGISPRCIPCGTVLHVIWARTATASLYVAVVNPSLASSTPVPAVLVSDLDAANPTYDACVMGGAVYAAGDMPGLIAWSTALGWRLGYVHPSGVIGSPLTGLPSAATYADVVSGGIACSFDKVHGTLIGAVYTDAAGVGHVKLITASTLVTAASVLPGSFGVAKRVACEFGESGLWWATEHAGGRDDLNVVRSGACDLAGALTSDPATRVLRGHTLASRAFYDAGDVYAAVCHPVQYFPYLAVVRLSESAFGGASTVAVARMLPGGVPGALPRQHVPSAQAVDPDASWLSRQHAITTTYRIQLAVDPSQVVSGNFSEAGIRVASLDFNHATSYQTAEHGRGLYLAGAVLAHYDGQRWAEADFHCAPDVAAAGTIATPSTAGGSMADGTYGYVLCYEEIDAAGELHQGATSAPILAVIAGGAGAGKVTLAIPTYRLTNKRNVRIGVYRSLVNQTGTSIPYYRVSGLDPSVGTGSNRYVANDPTADTVTFVDVLADASLATREPLYTNGGIASNDPAPMSGAVLAGGKSRQFWVDQTDPHLLRYSQSRLDDTALEAPARFSLPVDPYGGDIAAVGVMDDVVYPFTASAIYAVAGPGPLSNPSIQPDVYAFAPAALVTSDVGCISPGSICQTPKGITFQSAKGIKLLGRDRQVVDIGKDAAGYADQTIVRATLLPDRDQVVFLTDSGRSLLWDYERLQWSTWTNHEGLDAVVIGGTYYYLRTDGRVFCETPGLYRDDNSHIPMRIETAWIKLGGYLQGFQRILWAYFLGTYKSTHQLAVRFRCDYEEAWSPAFNLDVDANYNPSLYGAGSYGAGAYGGSGGPSTVYQRRLHLNRRCQAIQFRIEDVEPTFEFGAAFELSELLIIGGVLGPAFQAGPARSN